MENFEKYSSEELMDIIKKAHEIIEERNNKRVKELWGNVIAALRKFEAETGEKMANDEGQELVVSDLDIEKPGYLPVYYV